MKVINELAKQTPVSGCYDLIVAGGGPSGITAAVAAARQGMKTLLIERSGSFGGMATNGLVPTLCPYVNSLSEKPLIKGIGFEILERMRAGNAVGDRTDTCKWVAINAEKLKLIFDEMVLESNCDYLFFTTVSDVIVENGGIKALIIENKSGRTAVEGKMFIDCTGDADVAYLSGVPTVKGDEAGNVQASTLCFLVAGINVEKYIKFYNDIGGSVGFRKFVRAARRDGRLKEDDQIEFKIMGDCLHPDSGFVGFNFGHIYNIDATDASQVSKAMMLGRKLAHDFMEFARTEVPGMENTEIVSTGSLLGVRESRRIVGEFVLSEDAYFEGHRHEDDIAVYDYPVDVHDVRKNAEKDEKNPYGKLSNKDEKPVYGIPFRVLLPRGIDNLLVAGRSISADRPMQGTSRVMPACFAMGEAAGTAAALSVNNDILIKELAPAELRRELLAQGVFLSEVNQ